MVFLRVQLLGVQANEPWRYYVALQVLGPGSTAAADLLHGAGTSSEVACRTDTARPSRTPVFNSRTFLLRLPASDADAVQHASSSSARLAVSLFAAPSVEAPAGPIIAGREVDRLAASAVLDLDRQLLQRLDAGEHVAVPVLLQEAAGCRVQQLPEGLGSQAAQLQSLRSSQKAKYNSSKPHVLLELMLLNGEPPRGVGTHSLQQQDAAGVAGSMLLGESFDAASSPQAAAAAAAAAVAATAEAEQGDTELLVLVSAASNVPLVPGARGELEAPSAFVTLRVNTSTAAAPPQASTSAAEASTSPVWGELLRLSCKEAQLSHSRLHITFVSQSSNRAVAKGSLKLSGCLPGQHYNLALALTDTCSLYITVLVRPGCGTLVAALQGSGLLQAAAAWAGQLQVLQLELPQFSQPVQNLLQPGLLQQEPGCSILAIWRCTSSTQQKQQQQQQAVYITLDGREGQEAASAAMLRMYNSSSGLLAVGVASRASSASSSKDAAAGGASNSSSSSSSSLKGLEGVLAAVPLWCSGLEDTHWKPGHMVSVPVVFNEQTAVTLELHLQPWQANSSKDSSSSRLPPSVCFARATLPLAALASKRVGSASQLPNMQLSINPQMAAANAAGAYVTLQATRWDVASFLRQLQQLAAQQQQQQQQQLQSQAPVLLSCPSPVPNARGSLVQQHSSSTLGAAGAAAAAPDTVELLLGDLLAKQQALERLQQQLDLTEQHAGAVDGRVADLQAANSKLSGDLQHLRQLLHEEKEAAAAASSLLDSSQPHLLPGTLIPVATATKEQVLQQMSVVLSKHATERARNMELVRRLQQLHAERVDVMELQQQFVELQEAHFQQSKLLVDQEIHQHTLSMLKKAVVDQEALITRLQQLLAAAAARTKELEGWRSTAEALQHEVSVLREQLESCSAASAGAERQAAAQAAAAALADSEAAAAKAAANFEAQLMTKESVKLAAVMRAEKAETSAVAAQNELLEVTKRYAREIAQLKTKLAEKAAQLLGGFGSIEHLTLGAGGQMPLSAAAAAAGGQTGLEGFAGLPGLHNLTLPSLVMPSQVVLTAGQSPGPAAGRSTGSRGGSPAVAEGRPPPLPQQQQPGAATPAGSSKGGSRRASSQAVVAAGAALAATAGPAAHGASGRGTFSQQASYTLRAGSAEARLMHQHGDASQQRSGSRGSKPGSPLIPTVQQQQQQQRLTNSADGVRSPKMAVAGSSARVPLDNTQQSPPQQQQGRTTREFGSPQQVWPAANVHQQQQAEAAQEQDEYEDSEGEEEEEEDVGQDYEQQQAAGDQGTPQRQQQQQPQQQPPGSPFGNQQQQPAKKRGGLAGFFSRG